MLNREAFDQMKDGVMVINTQPRRPDRLSGGHRRPEAPGKLARWGWTFMRTNAICSFEDKSNDVIQGRCLPPPLRLP
ncbi:hypothetical protein LNO88_12270 [Klebsiella pneumoniae subsp. pneumoniae]|nr:hypothetical protein [Klebsiella pneumoniae subsp. pneumoniae]